MARVLIGIPMHGGSLSAQTFHSVTTAQSNDGHEISFQVLGLSLLARNFNTMYLTAKNKGLDYFFLHHSDIGFEAKDGVAWIDLMIRRLTQLKAAALSVVSPIKSMAGHTSTGLILDKDNPYKLRRLTIKECNRLPEPFITRKNVCELFGVDPEEAGALLVNTAGLLMDLKNFDWTQWPGFEIRDCIVWNRAGVGAVRTIPEDWNFSAWMHGQGWPYYATREIGCHHIGQYDFTNFGDWGAALDDQPRETSIREWEDGNEQAS